MRTLGEIINTCKNGERPTDDEMRYAICALDALITLDGRVIMALANAERDGVTPSSSAGAVWQWQEMFNRLTSALATNPKQWLGHDNDPDNPDYQARRAKQQEAFDIALLAAEVRRQAAEQLQ